MHPLANFSRYLFIFLFFFFLRLFGLWNASFRLKAEVTLSESVSLNHQVLEFKWLELENILLENASDTTNFITIYL